MLAAIAISAAEQDRGQANRQPNILFIGSDDHVCRESQKPVAASKPKGSSRNQFFKNRDRNGDGAITLEEFISNPTGRNAPP